MILSTHLFTFFTHQRQYSKFTWSSTQTKKRVEKISYFSVTVLVMNFDVPCVYIGRKIASNFGTKFLLLQNSRPFLMEWSNFVVKYPHYSCLTVSFELQILLRQRQWWRAWVCQILSRKGVPNPWNRQSIGRSQQRVLALKPVTVAFSSPAKCYLLRIKLAETCSFCRL